MIKVSASLIDYHGKEGGKYWLKFEVSHEQGVEAMRFCFLKGQQCVLLVKYNNHEQVQLAVAQQNTFMMEPFERGGAFRVGFLSDIDSVRIQAILDLASNCTGVDAQHQKTFEFTCLTQEEVLEAERRRKLRAEKAAKAGQSQPVDEEIEIGEEAEIKI